MLIFLCSLMAHANDFSVDRPSVGTSGATLGYGMLQLETGIELSILSPTSAIIPTLVRLGVTDSTEIRLFSDIVSISETMDYGPLGLEVKQTLWQNDSFIVGALANGVLPFDGSGSDASAIALLDYMTGNWAFWGNVGLNLAQWDDLQMSTLFAVGGGVNVTENIQVCLEQSGTIADSFSGYAQVSVLYVTEDTQWDVYYQSSVQDLSEHIVGVGYSQRWGVFEK